MIQQQLPRRHSRAPWKHPVGHAIVVCIMVFFGARVAILFSAPWLVGDLDWRKIPLLSLLALSVNYAVAFLFAAAEYALVIRHNRRIDMDEIGNGPSV